MSKPPQKRFWNSLVNTVFPRFKLEDAANPMNYIGKTVLAQRELDQPFEEVVIRDVQGCMGMRAEHLVKYFQINGTHFVHMHSFFMQMIEGRLPNDEEQAEFELATQIKAIKGISNGKEKSRSKKAEPSGEPNDAV